MFFSKKSDLPAPTNLNVGFSLDQRREHSFAIVWKLDSSRKTIRYVIEFSVDKKKFHAVPPELCSFHDKRADIPFSKFVQLMNEKKLDITKHRYIYWRVVAEFHDTAGKSFGTVSSDVAYFEMPALG